MNASQDSGRRWILPWLILGVLVSLASWLRPIPSPREFPEALRVGKVEIVDGTGNIRLRIGIVADGTPSVRLYDAAGTRRLELAVPSEGPSVTVFDSQGKPRRMLVAPPGLLETETLQADGNAGP